MHNGKPKMKDSGIEWIGEIPADWGTSKIKYLLREEKGSIKAGPFGSQMKSADMSHSDVKVYNQRTVLDNDFFSGEEYISNEKYGELKGFEVFAGDILITTRGTIGRTSIVPNNAPRGVIHPCLIRIRFDNSKILDSYLIKIFNDTNILSEQLKIHSNATTIDVVYTQNLVSLLIALPNIPTQQQIVKYLDRKCGEIDRVIAAKQKQNELLKKYRQAIIYEAVTKGLDKNVKYKDSGIEWIGEIPENWEIWKVKYVCDVDKNRISEATDVDYLFNYIDISSVTEIGGIGETVEMTFGKSPSRARMIASKGDIIISTVRTYLRAIAFIEESNKYICSTGFAVLTSMKRLIPRFAFYQALSEHFIQEVVSRSVGVSYPAITSNALSNIKFLIPSLTTQIIIADYLDQKCGEIDRIIKSNDNMIAKLKEYRQSVIYEAVTGKTDISAL